MGDLEYLGEDKFRGENDQSHPRFKEPHPPTKTQKKMVVEPLICPVLAQDGVYGQGTVLGRPSLTVPLQTAPLVACNQQI